MEYFPAPLEKLVEQFARLPGIGGKSAQRLAFHVLGLPEEEAREFAEAILDAKRSVTCCPECQNFTAGGLCPICASPKRDGSVICIGKGNEEYNNSSPHGAGRKMSRKKAKSSISLEEFETSMQGIFSTCVSRATLDEAPMAYKDGDSVLDNIHETAEIVERLRPVYNFKSPEW